MVNELYTKGVLREEIKFLAEVGAEIPKLKRLREYY